MIDIFALKAILRGDEDALVKLIDKYNAYVCAVVRGIIGGIAEDVEEVAADVFFALWNNADKPDPQKLKAYLGGIARNKAKNKLRERVDDLPLEEDCILIEQSSPETNLIAGDETAAVKTALLAMREPDREIFLRHYYGLQTVAAIAGEIKMSEAAVKQRLTRGREKLKINLIGEETDREETNFRHFGLRNV
ncbi:MAG: sigma-70 family RNA polymerase sigma factor [Oscillospiraceae bacterium]|nr:sigma-70 family RNA polymerase sigma factor [Oscillospiraceae bacterium]